jgi:hypothetical protein
VRPRRHTFARDVAAILAGIVLVTGPAAAQDDVPRVASGRPDLQGVWDFRTTTPMERPEDLADKAFLTEEQAQTRDQEAIAREIRLWNKPAERTEAGTNVDRRGAGEAPGSYNQFWIDRGTNTVGTRRTSLVIDPPNGRIPPMTPGGERRRNARQADLRDNPSAWTTSFSSGVRCVLGFNAGPPMNPSAYNNNMQLFQTDDHVVIMTEMVNTSRVVAIEGPAHAPQTIRQWSGDSRAHWEGDTLVIETTNFDAKRQWRNTTNSAHLIERLTRVDEETLLYVFTVTDPDTWAAPWTAEVPMRKNTENMYEYACHEGNYSMPVMLGGQRVEERAAAGLR